MSLMERMFNPVTPPPPTQPMYQWSPMVGHQNLEQQQHRYGMTNQRLSYDNSNNSTYENL